MRTLERKGEKEGKLTGSGSTLQGWLNSTASNEEEEMTDQVDETTLWDSFLIKAKSSLHGGNFKSRIEFLSKDMLIQAAREGE